MHPHRSCVWAGHSERTRKGIQPLLEVKVTQIKVTHLFDQKIEKGTFFDPNFQVHIYGPHSFSADLNYLRSAHTCFCGP
jgi:hypothetical protein